MKKVISILIVMMFGVFCGCSANEVPEIPGEQISEAEKTIWNIAGKDYELEVPAKTRMEFYEGGEMAVYTSSISDSPVVVDFSALSGCDEITRLSVYISSETEKIVVPNIPNLEYCYFFSALESPIGKIDLSAAEKVVTIDIDALPEELIIGNGTENLILGKGFDLSKISGGENLKSITLHGGADLSLIDGIGEIEKVYISGEGSDIGELENLKSMKRLSLIGTDFDLSGIKNLTMETLALGDYVGQGTVDSITGSETITDLHISDRKITDVTVIEKMPNLKTILLTVDSVQDSSITLWYNGTINEEMLDLLKTNVDKAPLKEFIQNGGEIYIFADPNRATVSSMAE